MKLLGFQITRAAEKREVVSVENPKYALDDPRILESLGLGGAPMGDVSPRASLGIAAVYACTRALAESVAALPLCVLRTKKGKTTPADDISLADLLKISPNGYQTSFEFREMGMAHACLWGNFYGQIEFDRLGEVIGINPYLPWECRAELFQVGPERKKRFLALGNVIDQGRILHIPALGWDGVQGLSPIAQARMGISLALNADEFGAKFFANQARPSGVLQHPGKLSKDAQSRLREQWSALYSGASNAGKVAILEEGMSFAAMTMPLDDAEFLATRKYQATEIARIFRVPPHMIGDLDRATFSNIEQQSIEFVTHSLRPWLVRWENEINRKLLTPAQRKGGYFVRFDVDDLLRGDMLARYQAYQIGKTSGFLTTNDIRKRENLEPVEGGDKLLDPLNMKPTNEPAQPGQPGAKPPESQPQPVKGQKL